MYCFNSQTQSDTTCANSLPRLPHFSLENRNAGDLYSKVIQSQYLLACFLNISYSFLLSI